MIMYTNGLKISSLKPLSEFLITVFFIFFLTIFSVWVLSVHIAGVIGISFKSLCIVYTFFLVTSFILLLKNFIIEYTAVKKNLDKDETQAILMLAVLTIITSSLSLIVIRPDLDDVNYSSHAVYFLKYYTEIVDFKSHSHWLPGSLPSMAPVNITNTISLFCAYFSFALGIPFLHVYHFFLPTLTGAMIPLGWFLVFTKFTNKRMAAVLASTAVCVFLCMNGEPHRTFGNFAFVRIWQGKAILMSVVLPVFIAFTIDFFHQPAPINWNKLFVLNCSAAGLSMIAVYFMPIAGFLIGSACLSKNRHRMNGAEIVKSLIFYSLSYFYLLIIALSIAFLVMLNNRLVEYIGFTGWPNSFMGQFRLVFMNYQFFIFAVFLILCLISGNNENRKFVIIWIILCGIFFLNPIFFPIISKYVTTLNTYWRLFYLLPFPFVIGLPIAYLGGKLIVSKSIWWLSFIFLINVAIIGNAMNYEHATFRNLSLYFGQYKIDKALEKDVRSIVRLGKPGPMLAPLEYSAIIPLYSADYPQVVVRKFTFKGYALQNELSEEVNRRFRAADFVSGKSNQGIEDIGYLIKKGLMNIVIDSSIKSYENWIIFSNFLENFNFKLAGGNDRFLVYTKKN